MLKLKKEMVKENIELLEEANDVKNALVLLSNIGTDPIGALNKHIEGSTNDERIENVNNITEGLSNALTKDKALVLASEYALGYLKEEINECVKELDEMATIKDAYTETLMENYSSLSSEDTLSDDIANLTEAPLVRIEYTINKITEQISLMITNSDVTNQISVNDFMNKYMTLINSLSINTSNMKDMLNRIKSDLLLNTAYNMYKDGINSEEISSVLNVVPVEPQLPTDNKQLVGSIFQMEQDDKTSETYQLFISVSRSIISKIKELETDISNIVKIAKTKSMNANINKFNKFITDEAVVGIDIDKVNSLVTMLQYNYNNVTVVTNEITKVYSDINNNIFILNEAYDLNKRILS